MWMTNQRSHNLSPGDIAIQLDLISKVYGLQQAEKYFNSIPEDLRVFQVYGALLNCYAQNKSLEKAEAVMEKMRDLGSANTSLSYNAMLNLYLQLGKYEKLNTVIEEMEEKGIICDKFTYNIHLNAYGATSNFEGMEKLLKKMEVDPHVTVDWHAYIVAANWYLKTGLTEKCLVMLKRSEQLISGKTRRRAYEIFLTLYAAAGKRDEVYRIWNLYKNLGKALNSGYLCIISSLMKLNDVDGAEKILEEWENEHSVYDFRVPNCMISTYCRKGLLEKADAYVNRLIESGKEPGAATWDRLATGYYVNGKMEKSVETLKRAILASRPGWMPNRLTFAACLEYLRRQGNVEVVEELLELFRGRGHSLTDIYDKLGSSISNETLGSRALDQMEREEQIVSGETHEFVEFKDEGSS